MFQESTAPYLFAAYGVFIGGMLIYLASLVLRRRNVEREAQVLDQIAEELARERAGSQRLADERLADERLAHDRKNSAISGSDGDQRAR